MYLALTCLLPTQSFFLSENFLFFSIYVSLNFALKYLTTPLFLSFLSLTHSLSLFLSLLLSLSLSPSLSLSLSLSAMQLSTWAKSCHNFWHSTLNLPNCYSYFDFPASMKLSSSSQQEQKKQIRFLKHERFI